MWKDRKPASQQIEGEIAFIIEGYTFFIHHNGHYWTVSDVAMGAAIARDHRYKEAIRKARERIERDVSHYIDLVAKELSRREGAG
ncbi:hypothetical protein D3C76_1685210 [compost metagenome]